MLLLPKPRKLDFSRAPHATHPYTRFDHSSRGLHVSVNARYLGDAPLVEDGSVRSDASWLVHAGMAWHRGRAEFGLDLFNLLDSGDDDIAYYYASRLAGEPASGILDMHFHPLEPRTLRARLVLHL